MENRRNLIAVTILAALASGTALADDQRTGAMMWGSALDGTLEVGAASAEIDMSLEDILNVLDGSIALRHESRGASRGWYAEYIFNDLKQEASGALGERQANLQQEILELGMSMPFADAWEVYGGVRWETVDQSIEFAVLPTARASMDWTDALLGVRWQRSSSHSRWWARGDVAGGGSDGAFLVEAGGAWRFGDGWEMSLAYRALDTSYQEAATSLDLMQSGAVLGVSKDW
jgi:hypothetical protein